MADPDAPSWFLDDDVVEESTDVGGDEGAVEEDTASAKPVEAPKPPAEWRKTYKLAVSNLTELFLRELKCRVNTCHATTCLYTLTIHQSPKVFLTFSKLYFIVLYHYHVPI